MASAPHAEAFALLTLPDVLLSTSVGTERGSLVVECVTPHTAPGVVLVIRVGALEAVIDPRRQVTLSAGTGEPRVYTFHAIPDDASELILTLPALSDTNPKANAAAADVETLDTVLEQYVHFTPHTPHLAVSPDHQTYQLEDAEEDFRGRLVLVDETNGEVLGAVGERDTIRADPILQTKGHEKDAVVIDVGDDSELGARQRFAQAIPPGEHDAITRTASMLSTGISKGASLLASGLTSASNLYISRVAPHPSTNPDGVTPPPRAVQWLTSDSTRKGLDTAQLYTGKAYQVSQKTLNAVEGVMTRVLAPNKGKGRAVPLPPKPDSGPPLMFDPNLPPPVRSPVRPASAQPGMPPPYSSTKAASSAYSVASPPYTQVGPPPTLPPRKGAASAPPSPRSATPPTPLDRLSKKARFVLSAQLVLSTLDASTKKVANAGTEGLAAAVGHKYGASAESSTRVLTGTARNVALVYVDVTGLGRRALIKRAGMAVIKTRINGKTYNLKTDSSGQVVEVQPSSPVAGSPIGRRSTEKIA